MTTAARGLQGLRRTCAVTVAAGVVLALSQATVGATASGVRLNHDGYRTRLVVDLSAPAAFRLCRSSEPLRVFLALDQSSLSPGASLVAAEGPLLRRVVQAPDDLACPAVQEGMALRNGDAVPADPQLVLELTLRRDDVRVDAFELGAGYGADHRVVLDVYPAGNTSAGVAPGELTAIVHLTPPTSEVVAMPSPAMPSQVIEDGADDAQVTVAASRSKAGADPAPAATGRSDAVSTPGLLHDVRPVGYAESAIAFTTSDPSHWSRLRMRAEAGATGRIGDLGRFKVVGRAQGDAAYASWNDFYPTAVREDQRSNFWVREAYVDLGTDSWDFRLGRQHVVWGEMVGLFLADVVSARDTREFFLEEFETMRIPQWALRAERFMGDAHVELLWIPYMSYDVIGEPGADFYPFPVEAGTPVREVTPDRSEFRNQGLGARFSYLVDGWDHSAFYYQSSSVAPTLYRTNTGLELRNDQIEQVGGTFSKDFMSWVFKGEAVYTTDRNYLSLDPTAPFGLETSDALDYVVGITVPRGNWRFDAQLYGRHVVDYQATMGFDRNETGITLLANYRFGDRGEAEVLYLSGLNREDWSLQPSVTWNVAPEWRLRAGADLFGGDAIGLFGQFDAADRVFVEVRRWF